MRTHTYERNRDGVIEPSGSVRWEGPRVTSGASRHFGWELASRIEIVQSAEATGTPLEPGRAGREAIHDFGEALDRLAE